MSAQLKEANRRATQAMANAVGTSAIIIGAVELVPVCILVWSPEDTRLAPSFIFPALFLMAAGYVLRFAKGDKSAGYMLERRDAAACMLAVWLAAIVAYALPFVLAHELDPVQAVFEATSGLTTTGLSVMDPDECPRMLLLHRSLMHYLGGVGLVLVLTCMVSRSGGLGMYNVEGHVDRLLPGTARTARTILAIYSGIIALGAVAYRILGMSAFDAINTSISAVSTGGFSTHVESIAYFDSRPVEAVSAVLMLAGATNFLLLFLLLRGKVESFAHHIETRVLFGVVAVASVAIAAILVASGCCTDAADALWTAFFQTVSAITSTGFQIVPSFAALPSGILLVLVSLMLAGSMAGSTSGGIKLYRIAVSFSGLLWSLQERYGTKHRIYGRKINRFGKRVVCTETEVREAATFAATYILVFAIGSFAFALCGASFQEAVFDFASCLGNAGIGVGFLGAGSGPVELGIGAFGMLLGRLEIVMAFIGLAALLERVKRRVAHGR